jgi:hypothetical protein
MGLREVFHGKSMNQILLVHLMGLAMMLTFIPVIRKNHFLKVKSLSRKRKWVAT